jgi:hypothetical protein
MDLVSPSSSETSPHRIIRSILFVLLLTILFGIAYTQSPLYTSNQNQYFLHGFADAGYGYLKNDWLASTTETTPIFRVLVASTLHLFQNSVIFYFYYVGLMGIYLFSILGIVTFVIDINRSRTIYLLFVAILLTIHSAAFRFLLSQTIGDNWKYILEDGLADQRLLGSVFQPSSFGVFLLLSIYLFLKERPGWAVFFAVLAATIHPTYLLGAAALVLSFMAITYKEEESLRKPLLLGIFAIILVLPILTFSYINFAGTPAETSSRAQDILVNFRIPHHAKFEWWLDATALVKIAIILWAIYLIRKSSLYLILLIPFSIAAVLTIIQITSDSNTLALIFPWRISTFLVPLSTSIILAKILNNISRRYPKPFDKHKNLINFFSVLLITSIVLIGAVRFYLDYNRKLSAVENKMMAHVAATHSPDDIYFVPKKMQDFRLATGSPVYIEFKSIPYRDTDVLEWYDRIQNVERFYKNKDCSVIYGLLEDGNATRVVIPVDNDAPNCERLLPIYQDDFYAIYKLDTDYP